MRKKIRFSTILLSVLIMLLLTCANAFAAEKKLSVGRVKQAKTNWCWAASSEMVGKYGTASSRTQYDVVNLIWGSTYPNLSGTVANMVSGVQYVSNYSKGAYSSGFISKAKVKSSIEKNHPLIVRLAWDSGGGHAVVISGYKNSSLYTIDPWKSTASQYYVYSYFKNGGTFKTGTGHATHVIRY